MELYLMRHGEAGKRMSVTPKDHERTLTLAGRAEIERVAGSIAESGMKFDVIAASPLRRAKDTATIVGRALGKKVEEWPELSPEGNRIALFRRLAKLRADATVLCVGHEPYLTNTIAELIGVSADRPRLRISLKKGGLAKVAITGTSLRTGGELRWLLTPRQVRKLG